MLRSATYTEGVDTTAMADSGVASLSNCQASVLAVASVYQNLILVRRGECKNEGGSYLAGVPVFPK